MVGHGKRIVEWNETWNDMKPAMKQVDTEIALDFLLFTIR